MSNDVIKRLRASSAIDRATYEAALWGDEAALARCEAVERHRRRRVLLEEASP